MAHLDSSLILPARRQPDFACDNSTRSRDDWSIRLGSNPDFQRKRDVPFVAQPELKSDTRASCWSFRHPESDCRTGSNHASRSPFANTADRRPKLLSCSRVGSYPTRLFALGLRKKASSTDDTRASCYYR